MITNYEFQEFPDNKIPISFHIDRIYSAGNKNHSYENVKNNILNENRLHWHEGIEILRFNQGMGFISINNKKYKAKKGDIVVINANQLHRISVAESECVYDVLGIDYKFCCNLGYDICNIFYTPLIYDNELCLLFDKISNEFFTKPPFYKTIITAACMQIIALMTRDYTLSQQKSDFKELKKFNIVRQIMQYISKNYASQKILSELSINLGYSQFYLTHIFSDLTGMSVKEYQMYIRFHFAKDMIANTALPIFEIARNSGYNNSASFTAEFKKRNGRTPLEYRYYKKGQNTV